MSEWWTYRLSDFLLFSPRTYYRLFELYNRAIWPAHLVALVAGAVLLAVLARPSAGRSRLALALLGGAWLWVAVAFHLGRYLAINWAARWFGWGAIAEAALLLALGAVGRWVVLERRPGDAAGSGLALAASAVVVLPLLGPLLGRDWHQMELFALAPDPTAVATLGALLLVRGRGAWALWIVPLGWCAITGATLWTMHAPDAWVVPALAGVALCRRHRFGTDDRGPR